mmetsp:Transcript_39545/g.86135  ORF Transcript_39545/g.86135 Transcript_39545/m.86135 type:complete len:128 (-) Transcript_39545:317-700(-)
MCCVRALYDTVYPGMMLVDKDVVQNTFGMMDIIPLVVHQQTVTKRKEGDRPGGNDLVLQHPKPRPATVAELAQHENLHRAVVCLQQLLVGVVCRGCRTLNRQSAQFLPSSKSQSSAPNFDELFGSAS